MPSLPPPLLPPLPLPKYLLRHIPLLYRPPLLTPRYKRNIITASLIPPPLLLPLPPSYSSAVKEVKKPEGVLRIEFNSLSRRLASIKDAISRYKVLLERLLVRQ